MRVIELAGPPGSGKTNLLAELASEADRRGLTVISGRCAESERHLSFRAVAPLLSHFGIAQAPHPNTHLEIRAAITRIPDRKTLVVIDDFHWADEDSVALVDHLMRWTVPAPLLLVIAFRTGQLAARLRASLSDATATGTAERIEITPFSLDESAYLFGLPRSSPALARLHTQGDGNPLYMLALAADRPGAAAERGTRALEHIAAEVDALDPIERTVAHAAAVLGDGVDIDILASVAGLTSTLIVSTVQSLETRGILRPAGGNGTFALRHPVVRAVLLDTMPSSWRTQAHRRALHTLTRRGAPATEIAAHIEHARPVLGASEIRILSTAARSTMATDPQAAVRLLEVGLRSLPGGAGGPRLELTMLLARALGVSGRLTECRDLLHSVLNTIPATMTGERASAIALCTVVESLLGHLTEAHSLLLKELSGRDDAPAADHVSLTIAHSMVQMMGGMSGAEPVGMFEAPHDDQAASSGTLALQALGHVFASNFDRALVSIAQCMPVLDGLADADLVETPEYLLALGWAESTLGSFADSKRHLQRAVRLVTKSGQTYLMPVLLACLCNAYRHTGPVSDALDAADQAERVAHEIGAPHMQALALALKSLSMTRSSAADAAHAMSLAEEAFTALPPGTSRWSVTATLALAVAASEGGNPRRGVDLVLDACGGTDLPAVPMIARPLSSELLAASAVAAATDPAPWVDLANATAERLRLPTAQAYAAACRAHGARWRQDYTTALHEYLAAAELFRHAEMTYEHIRMLSFGSACADADGDTDRAVAMLALAVQFTRTYGATKLTAELDDRLAELNARLPNDIVRQMPNILLSRLTEREREVALAAARGKRTREIAEELTISPRTADVHLTRIYRKLGVRSRTALARLLADIT